MKFRIAILFFIVQIVSACTSSSIKNWDLNDLTTKAMLSALKPQLESAFLNQAPLLPASSNRYKEVRSLPGPSFSESKIYHGDFQIDKNGNFNLAPGDYSIPVMTYCMNANGSSPAGFTYALSKMQGTRSAVIRQLNLKAYKYRPQKMISLRKLRAMRESFQERRQINRMVLM
jgi:hypothetical protein